MSSSFPLSRFSPQRLSVLRIVGAFLLITHGTVKLFGFPANPGEPAPTGPAGPIFRVAGWIEVAAGPGPWSVDAARAGGR